MVLALAGQARRCGRECTKCRRVGHMPQVASGVDEGAGPLFGGTAGAGLSGVRDLPWGRRTRGSPGSSLAPLPPARRVLRELGCSRLAGHEPMGWPHQGPVAIVGPEPADLSS